MYNGAAFIGEALESVASQQLSGLEIIVSDNASTDATPEILASWAARLPMRIVRRQQTMPMRDHFNALLDEVDSEFYMVLCHDDYLASSEALAKACKVLEANPEVSAVYCDLLYVNEHRRTLARRSFGREGLFDANAAGQRSLRSGRNCFGIPLAIRRESLGALRYDPKFLYAMDLDLSWSVSLKRPAYHIPEPLIANRYSRQNTTWALLASARQEFFDLAGKYLQPPGRLEKFRITATCFGVAQQKRLFGLYERLRTWAD